MHASTTHAISIGRRAPASRGWQDQRGFTLLELRVVLGILALVRPS
jgi:prepilin-type N-terminal cleavage/methylation domain-containing protein